MVRKYLLILLVCLLPVTALASVPQVTDEAGIFTSVDEAEITAMIDSIEADYPVDLAVLTTTDTPLDSSESLYLVSRYADDWYDSHGMGVGEEADGMLILIDMKNRVLWLSTSGSMILTINDRRENVILDGLYNRATYADYAGGVMDALSRIRSYLNDGTSEGAYLYDESTNAILTNPYNHVTPGELLAAFCAGVAAMFIVVSSVSGKYNLKGMKYDYDLSANADFTLEQDDETYLRQTVSRRPRVQSSGSSGHSGSSGSSHSSRGGSGVHRSSSGRSHGGGGRRF